MEEYPLRTRPDFEIMKGLKLWTDKIHEEKTDFLNESGGDFMNFLDELQSAVTQMLLKRQTNKVQANRDGIWEFISEFAKKLRDKEILPDDYLLNDSEDFIELMTKNYRKLYKRKLEKLFIKPEPVLDFSFDYFKGGFTPALSRVVSYLIAIGNNLIYAFYSNEAFLECYKQLLCLAYLRNACLSSSSDLTQLCLLHLNLAFITATLKKFALSMDHLSYCFQIVDLLIEIYKVERVHEKPLALNHFLLISGQFHPLLSIFPDPNFPETTDLKSTIISFYHSVVEASQVQMTTSLQTELRAKATYYRWIDSQIKENAGKVVWP